MRTTRFVALAVFGLLAAVQSPVRAGFSPTFEVVRTVRMPTGGAEIVAVSPNGKLAAVTQISGRVQTLKLPNGKLKKAVDVSDFGEPTSVAFADDKTLFAVVLDDPNPGTLVIASAKKGKIISTLPLGIGPDSIAIDRTRKLAVISIEDEETEVDDPYSCPPENTRPGSIQIVDFSQGFEADRLVLTTLPIDLSGLPNPGCPNDPQPELVAIDSAAGKAYVTVQENNALAVVDLTTKTIERVVSAETTTHLAYTNPDAPAAVTDPMTGRREPDGVAVSPDGRYLFTADEGDTETTGDGVFSGGRTMSVWDAETLEIVTDTGDQIERAVVEAGLIDSGRADAHGAEPEGVTVFAVDGVTVAALTLERARAVIFFDVTVPTEPSYLAIVQVGTRPEGIVYVPSLRLVLTGNETSNDVTFIEVDSQ